MDARQRMLIEDLLSEGYEYVLTSRFQSDPLERRFSQYHQMSGGRFLVGLREVNSSEKNLEDQKSSQGEHKLLGRRFTN